MKLRTRSKTAILEAMRANGTREDVVARVRTKLRGPVLVAQDDRWTFIVNGKQIGYAKRNTYARTRDANDESVGLAIAASRL